MHKIRIITAFLIVFSLGWLLNNLITGFVYYDAEKPLPLSVMPFMKSPERLSPSDRIKEEQIHVYSDRVVLDIEGANWAKFTNTNSMDPFMDEDSNSIEIRPTTPNDIKEGDIVSYYSSITGDLVVHRVIGKDSDSRGVFYILKGDNNSQNDPEKVRFEQVHGVLVAIIY